jgi:ubiquinone biosynthesis monooxygenase Coq7
MNYKHLFTSQKDTLHKMVRVNHAGELGAKQIYLGQLMALKEDAEILEMLESELKHLEFFEDEIIKNGYSPSIFNPIWQKLAFLMGFVSAKSSRKMAMLCTFKVEEVIEKHYQEQIEILEEGSFKDALIKFRKEEIEHLNAGEKQSQGFTKYGIIFTAFTKLGIFFSSKF